MTGPSLALAEDLDRRAQEAQRRSRCDVLGLPGLARSRAQDLDVARARCMSASSDSSHARAVRRRARARPASTIDVGARELAELAQLGVGERGLRRPAAAEHARPPRREAAGERLERVVGGVGRRELVGVEHEHPRDVDRDVAVADDHGALAPTGRTSWSAASGWPLYQATNSVAACEPGQVLAGDPEPVVARGADARRRPRGSARAGRPRVHVARRARRRRRSGSPACAAVFS